MKPWQKALGDIRVLGPDVPAFRKAVKLVWDHIESLEGDTVVEAAEEDQGWPEPAPLAEDYWETSE